MAVRLANPDLDVLLVVAGVLLVYLEFNIPGTVVPGALGVLSLTLGLYGLSLLPLHLAAIAILLGGLALILLELRLAARGALVLAGIASLIFGFKILVEAQPGVHTATAISAGAVLGAVTYGLGWIALRARRNKTLPGPQGMLGKPAVTHTSLAPTGKIEVRGELWSATLRDPATTLPPGAPVLIRQCEGRTLIVDPT